MSLVVIVATVASVWIFFALLLAGCAHGLNASRRAGRGSVRAATAWIGEEHAPVVRLGGDTAIPSSHPLHLGLPAPRHARRPSV